MPDEDVRVRFEPDGSDVTVPHGATLLDAAHRAGVPLAAPCGGVGRCGACRVTVEGAVSPLTSDEVSVLGGASVSAGKRLACRARALGDVVVTRPGGARAHARIVTEATTPDADLEPTVAQDLHRSGQLLGAAVDVGTTTVAAWLVDMRNGDVLAKAAAMNAQSRHGADVISRVAAALAGSASELQGAIVSQIESLIVQTLNSVGVPAAALAEVVCCGNTAMTSLLLGADTAPLAEAPYEGAQTGPVRVAAPSLGMTALGATEVLVPPGISAFVGSDITAGVLATHFDREEGAALYIDLGTNGEIVLRAHGRLLAASTAAGPALEGASIECGMMAASGAIEHVSLTGSKLIFDVIDGVEPTGICGSGLLDLIAVLLDAGVISPDGLLLSDAEHPLARRVEVRNGVRTFVVDESGSVMLTQRDVRQVQLALAAVSAGTDLLLAEAGVRPTDIVRVVVAGGFGLHVRPDSLIRTGLVLSEWDGRVTFAGNAALAGARMVLVNRRAREAAAELAAAVNVVGLAAHPEFQSRFLGALAFPS